MSAAWWPVAEKATGSADTPTTLTGQSAAGERRIRTICVSTECSSVDKTALRQFMSNWCVNVCALIGMRYCLPLKPTDDKK